MYKTIAVLIKSNMLYFDFKNIGFSFSFGFFFVTAFVCASGSILTVYSLLFCILHELSHLHAMRKFGAYVSDISFYGAGIKISSNGIWSLSKPKQIIIYSAGCAANILVAGVYFLIDAKELFIINLCLALLNILPVSYLDGGKILQTMFPQCEKPLRIISNVTVIAVAALFILCVIYMHNYCFSSLWVVVFVFIMSLILG